MKKSVYFCAAPKKGRMKFGYRSALSSDLALSCFAQDVGAELETPKARAFPVSKILLSRLQEYLPMDIDPWGCEGSFSLEGVRLMSPADLRSVSPPARTPYSNFLDQGKMIRDGFWHQARIAWLMKHPESLTFPIEIDNLCGEGTTYPVPVLVDGWHRYFASSLLRMETIHISYGGRTDLLSYLEGKRKTPPEY